MAKKIIVPVDGSRNALNALDVAVDLATAHKHGICLVHVVPKGGVPRGMEQWAHIEHVHESSEWLYDEGIAQNVLVAAEDHIAKNSGLAVERIVIHGDPAKCIVDMTDANDIEMVVMGSRGLSDFGGLVLGSVAHKVAHQAKCRVITVT